MSKIELPKGWVECSKEECTHAMLTCKGVDDSDGVLLDVLCYGPEDDRVYVSYSFGLEVNSQHWNKFGIIPVKKVPKPKQIKIVEEGTLIQSMLVNNAMIVDIDRLVTWYVYTKDGFKPGMRVRVTIEPIDDNSSNH